MDRKAPNIVFIHTDQQRADTLGCYGNPIVRSPHIDSLAGEGVLFENAFCTHPLCSPSRASWITGEYIHSHGLWRNGIALDEDRDNVVKALRDAGYSTVTIGKVHLAPYRGDPALYAESVRLDNQVKPLSEEDCWEYWRNQTFEEGYYGYSDVRMALGHGDYGMLGGHYGVWLHDNYPELMPLFSREQALSKDVSYDSWKSAVPLCVHSSTWITDQVEDYLAKKADDRPFLLSIGFQEPHPPFQPPLPYCDMYAPEDMPDPAGDRSDWGPDIDALPEHIQRYLTRQGFDTIPPRRCKEILALYYGMVTLVDDAVGRIVASLKKHGQYENTLIVFTSDHGDWMADHGLNRKGAVHTRGLIRIPMIVKWPGVSRAGLRVKDVASQVDLAATLYDAAGLVPHYTNQGTTLREVLAGVRGKVRDYALIEHVHERYREGGAFEKNLFANCPAPERKAAVQKEIINHSRNDMVMETVVTDRYRFTCVPSLGYGELFDWTKDQEERNDLYGKAPELQAEAEHMLLRALIESLPRCQERTFAV